MAKKLTSSCFFIYFIFSPSSISAASEVPDAVQPPRVNPDTLEKFVSDHWHQRFIHHAERMGWRDYQWDIKVVISEAAKKLPLCEQPYQADDAQNNLPVGRQFLRVKCPDTPGWTLTTRSQISVVMPVVTTKVALARDHILQESDLSVTSIQLAAHQEDILTHPGQAIGRRPLRSLRAGQPVRNRLLEAVWLVRKDDKVQLTMTDGKIAITMEGTALQNGQKGETISIKNEKSGKIISATVSAPGRLILLNEAASDSLQN